MEKVRSTGSPRLASPVPSSHRLTDSQGPLPLSLPDDDDEPPILLPPSSTHRKSIYEATNLLRLTSFKTPASGFSIKKIPFDRDPVELTKYLQTSLKDGLEEAEAQVRLKSYGKNILNGRRRYTFWTVLWKQVSNAMTVILLVSLIIAFATKDYPEGGVIAGTFIMNSCTNL
jgi:magnesium-transporting ATPase (P-type)